MRRILLLCVLPALVLLVAPGCPLDIRIRCDEPGDCPQGFVCVRGDCEPATTARIGAACDTEADCGPGLSCDTGFPGGYCLRPCSEAAPCPEGSVCAPGLGMCFQACGEACVRPGYGCGPVPEVSALLSACVPVTAPVDGGCTDAECEVPDAGCTGSGCEATDAGCTGPGCEAPDGGCSGSGCETPDAGCTGAGCETPDAGCTGAGCETPDAGCTGPSCETPDAGCTGTGCGTPDAGCASTVPVGGACTRTCECADAEATCINETCALACATDFTCPDGQRCTDAQCEVGARLGEPCRTPFDCPGTAQCPRERMRCEARCNPRADLCAAGYRCAPDWYCVRECSGPPASVGEVCENSWDCSPCSFCLPSGAALRCRQPCRLDRDCPGGAPGACEQLEDTKACRL
ncbi:hypothetical protein GCM10012319_54440 [Comamonas sp. KCTC 72670]|nr:hypothetical protein GCM10012319_54440 [Comamonas sp. KCTC 72670]